MNLTKEYLLEDDIDESVISPLAVWSDLELDNRDVVPSDQHYESISHKSQVDEDYKSITGKPRQRSIDLDDEDFPLHKKSSPSPTLFSQNLYLSPSSSPLPQCFFSCGEKSPSLIKPKARKLTSPTRSVNTTFLLDKTSPVSLSSPKSKRRLNVDFSSSSSIFVDPFLEKGLKTLEL